MQAFVSNWTRPYAVRCPDRPYQMTDFDLLTTVLSALVWRRENGSIRMITDDTGAQYYRSLGLTDLWDGGIFTYLNDIPSTIDPCTFWAAGKLYALAATPAPCVMLDTDFIVWHSLSEHWHRPLAVIHREALNPAIYPAPSAFVLAPSYHFPTNWNWHEPAQNIRWAGYGLHAGCARTGRFNLYGLCRTAPARHVRTGMRCSHSRFFDRTGLISRKSARFYSYLGIQAGDAGAACSP